MKLPYLLAIELDLREMLGCSTILCSTIQMDLEDAVLDYVLLIEHSINRT